MKTTVILTTIFFYLLQDLKAQNPTISGDWELNKANSIFGIAPAFVIPKQVTLGLTRDSLQLTFINVDEQDNLQPASSNGYLIDGSPAEILINDTVSRRVTVKVQQAGQVFSRSILFYNPANPEEPYRKVEETWTLSADGKTIVLVQAVQVKGGVQYEVKGVYDRIKG